MKIKNYLRYNEGVFTNRKMANKVRDHFAKYAKLGNLNLKFRVLKKGKRYFVAKESLRR